MEKNNFMEKQFSFYTLYEIANPDNGNIDVYVKLSNGKEYIVTFFTLNNVVHLMKKWQATGEYSGKYFWVSNSCIIEKLDYNTFEECISDMISTGQFEYIFMEVKQRNANDTSE